MQSTPSPRRRRCSEGSTWEGDLVCADFVRAFPFEHQRNKGVMFLPWKIMVVEPVPIALLVVDPCPLIHAAPMILLFFLAQRFFVKGIATTGIAGR